jgi:hypothetical protein
VLCPVVVILVSILDIIEKTCIKGVLFLSQIGKLTNNLKENIRQIEISFGKSDDLQVRKLHVRDQSIAFISIDGLVNAQKINELVDSLIFESKKVTVDTEGEEIWEEFAQVAGTVKKIVTFEDLNYALLSGLTVLLVNTHATGYAISTEG